MPEEPKGEWTQLLEAAGEGDAAAEAKLQVLIREEASQMAASLMRREPAGHRWTASDLLQEALLRLDVAKLPVKRKSYL